MISTALWKTRQATRRLATAWGDTGSRGLAAEAQRLARELTGIPAALGRELAFDLRRGTRTRGFVRNEAHVAARSVGGDPIFYQPIGLRPLGEALATVPVDRPGSTLVDLGAGRGRALLLAAEAGFGRVLGVELDESLAAEARENVRRWSRRAAPGAAPEVRVVHGDAATEPLPSGPLVVTMFNPFGATTLDLVLRSLCDARRGDPDPAWVVYVHPVHDTVFAAFPRFTDHARGRDWVVHRLAPEPAATGG
ncbi:methyltransferase domain-containing protein [Modestobacter sp. SSW1-42]|uniref:methyltransferase domain-containing protein n=1 Tax=Modestobacter sp. SSW1-42 TaxID=596372 RepID=UPI0039886DEB